MRKLIAVGFLVGTMFVLGLLMPHSESYIRARVVELTGNGYLCTGEQVHAKSGNDYVLTAAHCLSMVEGGYIKATLDNGDSYHLKVIEEDPTSDLLLLEPIPDLKGLEIANVLAKFPLVRTFTHGARKPTYETQGLLLGKEDVKVGLKQIMSLEDEIYCRSLPAKLTVLEDPIFGTKLCVLNVEEEVTTAKIVPGSSGGPVVDEHGDLVGVASATDDNGFGYLVRLIDIKAFLAHR